MQKTIGFILNGYHTELLDCFFELFQNYKKIVYIDQDDYNNIPILHETHSFIIKGLSKDLLFDYNTRNCERFIVLSHTREMFTLFRTNFHKNIIYLIHTLEELELIKTSSDNPNYFVVSNSVYLDKPNHYIFPFSKTTISKINFEYKDHTKINVLKVGWVTGSFDSYSFLNKENLKLHIFTNSETSLLTQLLHKYSNKIKVFYRQSSDFIYNYINEKNIKIVLYNPNNIDLWSGTLSFALNNNMILLTNEIVKKFYNFPKEFYININEIHNLDLKRIIEQSFLEKSKIKLQKYKNNIYNENLKIVNYLLL